MDWLGCHVFYTYSYRHIHSESDLIRHPYISITWNITLLSKRIINLLLFLSDLTIVLYWLCLFCSWKSDYQWCLVSINCPDSGKHWLQATPHLNTYTASNSWSATTSAIYDLYFYSMNLLLLSSGKPCPLTKVLILSFPFNKSI